LLYKVVGNSLSTSYRQGIVNGITAFAVGVSVDINQQLWLTLQHVGELGKRSSGSRVQIRLVGSEEDTRIEHHLHSGQTVAVGDFAYTCILHSSSLSLHIVHVLADEGASASTYSRTDSSTDSGTLGVFSNQVTNDTTEDSAATTTEQRASTSVGATTQNHQSAHKESHKTSFLHDV